MNLDAYLARLGLAERPQASAEGLATLQRAHREAIGFENLDIPLGRPIRIDLESVFDKLVTRGRGGYCFEQNALFGAALGALGLPNRPLLARVWMGQPAGAQPPRTHVLLLVEVDGRQWIADAGFGGAFVPPLPLEDGAGARTSDGAAHRLRRIGAPGAIAGEWLLERAGPADATDGRVARHEDWQAQYSFDLGEVAPDDLEQASHWTSTRPDTRFTTLHVASIVLPGGFAALTDRQFTLYKAGADERREIADPAEYAALLRETFRIALSEEEAARFAIFG